MATRRWATRSGTPTLRARRRVITRQSSPPEARCFLWIWVKKPLLKSRAAKQRKGADLRICPMSRSVAMLHTRAVQDQMINASSIGWWRRTPSGVDTRAHTFSVKYSSKQQVDASKSSRTNFNFASAVDEVIAKETKQYGQVA